MQHHHRASQDIWIRHWRISRRLQGNCPNLNQYHPHANNKRRKRPGQTLKPFWTVTVQSPPLSINARIPSMGDPPQLSRAAKPSSKPYPTQVTKQHPQKGQTRSPPPEEIQKEAQIRRASTVPSSQNEMNTTTIIECSVWHVVDSTKEKRKKSPSVSPPKKLGKNLSYLSVCYNYSITITHWRRSVGLLHGVHSILMHDSSFVGYIPVEEIV